MLLSAMTSADGSIWLNITKRQVRTCRRLA